MNRLLLCLVFLFAGFSASSQKVYFIYFQTESDQPFYLKMGDKVHASTGSGYLILSKLRDSTYTFQMGFPGNKSPELQFSVAVNKKDQGFLLKNFGEKGWGLFDLQTLAVQMPVSGAAANAPVKKVEKEVSDFTDVLSKAADDPSLKDKPAPAKTEEPKPVTVVQEVPKKEETVKPATEPPTVKKTEPVITPVTINETAEKKVTEKPAVIIENTKKEEPPVVVKEEVKPVPVVKEEIRTEKNADPPAIAEYKRSVVTRRSESSTTEGFGLVFTDELTAGSVDTIRLMIPNPKQALVTEVKKEEPKEEKKFLDIAPAADTVKKEEVKPPVEEVKVPVEEVKAPVTELKPPVSEVKPVAETKTAVKKNCSGTADENDFFEIRKRMAGETSDDNMIAEAKKYFKTKCFTTLQVKNLSLLFLNEEGKYHFFDAAYPYASDPENYSSLQSELKDTYYINRFRAMLRL